MAPRFKTRKQPIGGVKTCPKCGHTHKQVMSIDGKLQRPKQCVKCGAKLPAKLSYGKKPKYTHYVVEIDPDTGRETKHRPRNHGLSDSREGAEELRRQLERHWAGDEIQQQTIDRVSAMIRGIKADSVDDGIKQLIEMLGGDTSNMAVESIPWPVFLQHVEDEQEVSDRAKLYRERSRQVLTDLAIIADISTTGQVTPDSIRKYKTALKRGGWKREGRTIPKCKNATIKTNLATMRAAIRFGIDRNWIGPKAAGVRGLWAHRADAPEHRHMTDEEFAAIHKACPTLWWRALVAFLYNVAGRRQDALMLQWSDLDLDGENAQEFGFRAGTPTARVASAKTKRPRRTALASPVVRLLKRLQANPEALRSARQPLAQARIGDEHVFPTVGFDAPDEAVTRGFREIVISAGLTDAEGKAKYSLHTLRGKANTDLSRMGASVAEQMRLCGHESLAVNVQHYNQRDNDRMVELANGMPALQQIG